MQHLTSAILRRKRELIVILLAGIVLIVGFGCSIYFVESASQPRAMQGVPPTLLWTFGVMTNNSLSSFAPVTALGRTLQVGMILAGISVLSLLTGVVSGGFFDSIADAKQRSRAEESRRLLKQAFLIQPTIPERKIVEKLALSSDPTPRKFMTLETALTKLSLSQEDVLAAIRLRPGLRIREMPASPGSRYDSSLVVESFDGNTVYGSRTLRDAAFFHVVSTQSYSDAFVGHFSAVLASALRANYFSNEFFSSGALLPELQVNFAQNDAWLDQGAATGHAAVRALHGDLIDAVRPGTVAVYIGTAREPTSAFHVLLGGGSRAASIESVTEATVADLPRAAAFYHAFSESIRKLELNGGSEVRANLQQEYALEKPNHLSRFLHRQCRAEVLTVYVNVGLLRYSTYPPEQLRLPSEFRLPQA